MTDPAPNNPADAQAKLAAGNGRFLSLLRGEGNSLRQINGPEVAELAQGQEPWAVVLGCADSRVPTEYVFDCAPGELFVVRVAGNVAHGAQVGSIEFAVDTFAPRLVLVLGHTSCGAVKAALSTEVDEIESANLAGVVASIKPALQDLQDVSPAELDQLATEANVRHSMAQLRESTILAQAEAQGRIAIIGGVYQLSTGEVKFL